MSAPTTLVISYLQNGQAGNVAAITVPIAKPDATTPQDFTLAVRNLYLSNGVWYANGTGQNVFVPAAWIVGIVAS